MIRRAAAKLPPLPPPGYCFRAKFSSLLTDLPVILAGFALFYALLSLTHHWMAPVTEHAEISLSPWVLPKYAMFSVLRIAIAYVFSLAFTLSTVTSPLTTPAPSASCSRCWTPCNPFPSSVFFRGVMVAMVALVSVAPAGRRARLDPSDFHRPGLEHDLQLSTPR